jgi:O-antigen/teichoic acid export membrane protein
MPENNTHNLILLYKKYTSPTMKYFIRGGFWIGIGKIITGGLSILLAIGFANLLEKHDYGTYRYILSIFALLSISTLPGMQTAITRSIARGYEGALRSGILYSMRFGVLGATTSLIISAYYYFNNNTLFALSFLVIALIVPFEGSFSLYGGYLNGKKKYEQLTLYASIRQFIMVVLLFLSLLHTKNILILVGVYVIGNAVLKALILYFITHKNIINSKEEATTNSYGLHLSVIKSISIIAGTIQGIFLVQVSGVVALASFAIAVAPIEQIRGLGSILPTLIIPKISHETWKLPTPVFLLKKMLVPVSLISSIAFIYILSAPFIFDLLFPKYPEVVLYSQVFAISLIPTICINTFSSILKAQQETKKLYVVNIASDLSLLTLALCLTFFYGLWGLIIALVTHKIIMTGVYFITIYSTVITEFIYRKNLHRNQ